MSSLSSYAVIAVARVLLLGLAGGAVVPGVVVSHLADGVVAGAAGSSYVCPMHPEVKSSSPGACPICHMALELQAPKPPRKIVIEPEGAR